MLDFNDATQPPGALAVALDFARRGWPVFPCNAVNKRPLVEKGFHAATTNELQIRAWWTKHPNAMVGVPTGEKTGFDAFDIDTDATKGKDGIGSLTALGHGLEELTDTVVSRTGSGGYHCLYRHVPGVTTSRGSLPPHLDVRGEGGYIIAAGSTLADGRSYEWLNPPDENEIGDWPDWLLELISGPARTADVFDFNTAAKVGPNAAERASAIEPGTWWERTRDLVARLVREGLTDESIKALAPRFTEPGYTDAQTIREFMVHAQSARAKWGYQPKALDTAEAEPDRPRFKILTVDELTNVKPPEWRIDGIFPAHGSSVIYGAFETYKTFIALDMTLSLATGRDWMGRPVKPCTVLYVAGEGQVGLGLRVKGWLSARGMERPNFFGLPEAIALPTAGDQDDLLRAIDGMPSHPDVIVFDTVTRMTGGGSLNDEKDAQAYVRGVDRIRTATGSHIMNIGHSGKDKERGILGSIVLPAAMETIICVERRGESLTLINSNPKGKQKDGPNFEDIRICTRKVEFDHQGQAQTTLVLMPDDEVVVTEAEEATRPAHGRPQGANQQAVIRALKKAKGEALGLTRLAAVAQIDKSKVLQALPPLVQKGLVLETGEEGARRWELV